MTQRDDNNVRPGIYRHYKGKTYRVHGVSKHSETLEEMVMYEALYDAPLGKFWVRPKAMFLENVEIEGIVLPRFKRVSDDINNESSKFEELKLGDLVNLLSILQLTKEQPLTGYLTAGIKLSETATLAEHHYTTTLSGYLIGTKIIQTGASFDVAKLIKMLLVHDLSELFGGDIAGPFHRKYPDLTEAKDRIGDRAMQLLSSFLGENGQVVLKNLYDEFEDGKTNEAIVGKIMDQMDHQFFLEHHNYHKRYYNEKFDYRQKFTEDYIFKSTNKISDPIIKQVMDEFLSQFKKNLYNKGFNAINVLMGNN